MNPRLHIDLDRIEGNARAISTLASEVGIDVAGVTKACRGSPEVARAMLRGGVTSIADSRIENIKTLRSTGLDVELMLLRTPMVSEVPEVVEYADTSLNTEGKVLSLLSSNAVEMGRTHRVILMVEMGDLREGVPVDGLSTLTEEALSLPGIHVAGIGTNLACFAGVVPTERKTMEFCRIVEEVQERFDVRFEIVSGGNSANIPSLIDGAERTIVNQLRVGEGILLGLETVGRTPIPGTSQDAFVLEAELIELQRKPTVPDGEIAQNAFGEVPTFEDRGNIDRGILALGKQDVRIEGIAPLNDDISMIGAASDHLVVEVRDSDAQVGDVFGFSLDYGALVSSFTSSYVRKTFTGSDGPHTSAHGPAIGTDP